EATVTRATLRIEHDSRLVEPRLARDAGRIRRLRKRQQRLVRRSHISCSPGHGSIVLKMSGRHQRCGQIFACLLPTQLVPEKSGDVQLFERAVFAASASGPRRGDSMRYATQSAPSATWLA